MAFSRRFSNVARSWGSSTERNRSCERCTAPSARTSNSRPPSVTRKPFYAPVARAVMARDELFCFEPFEHSPNRRAVEVDQQSEPRRVDVFVCSNCCKRRVLNSRHAEWRDLVGEERDRDLIAAPNTVPNRVEDIRESCADFLCVHGLFDSTPFVRALSTRSYRVYTIYIRSFVESADGMTCAFAPKSSTGWSNDASKVSA